MANPTSTEVGVARGVATGALSWAPRSASPQPATPSTATAALATGYVGLGYVGSDGIQPTRDVSTDEAKDMNGDTVATLQTDFTRTYQAELLQHKNVDVKRMIFGAANVTVTPATAAKGTEVHVSDRGDPAEHGKLVADTFDGATKHREVAEDAQPTSVEFGPLVGTALRSYTVTWTVYRNSGGTFVDEYDNDGVTTGV